MLWIYLSPHFDDAALSCGGLVWEQVRAGDSVSIWTVCAGEPPATELSPFAQELHARWEAGDDAPSQRKVEDLNSCQRLGAASRYFDIPDCIYRRHPGTGRFLYASEAALSGPVQPGDDQTIARLREELGRAYQPGMNLVCPLAIGNHVDHQLTRLVLEGMRRSLWYYADYPYVEQGRVQVEELERAGWVSQHFSISQAGLLAWQDSIAAHASQISTFWRGETEMRQAIAAYLGGNNGFRLWRRPQA